MLLASCTAYPMTYVDIDVSCFVIIIDPAWLSLTNEWKFDDEQQQIEW